jgi:putative transposase
MAAPKMQREKEFPMPRKPRMYLADVPSHIVQRGNDREACFFEQDNYRFYLQCLGEACRRYAVSLHAYVLMTNHVHLLMTPSTAEGVSRVMQLVGNRYVQYINRSYGRTGTLWEGRHRSSLVDAEHYLLRCYRYIELNPVRAKIVSHPGEYRWSSCRHHTMGEENRLIADHETFVRLGASARARQDAYRALLSESLDPRHIRCIRESTSFSMPLGDERFRSNIEKS